MAIGELAIISTDKHWLNRPETAWSNTYEVRWLNDGFPGGAVAKEMMRELLTAERFLHVSTVQFTGARMANYVPKTVYPVPNDQEPPYDPTNTIPLIWSNVGARTIPGGDGVEPKNTIWWVNRAGNFGRVGTWEGRGCLWDSQVLDIDGDYTLIDPEQMETLLEGFAAALLVIEEKYGCEFVLAGEPLISATYYEIGRKKYMLTGEYGDTYIIPIVEWAQRGVRSDRAKKKWYNRV